MIKTLHDAPKNKRNEPIVTGCMYKVSWGRSREGNLHGFKLLEIDGEYGIMKVRNGKRTFRTKLDFLIFKNDTTNQVDAILKLNEI